MGMNQSAVILHCLLDAELPFLTNGAYNFLSSFKLSLVNSVRILGTLGVIH